MLVTGASTGIGRACAEHLARAGFTVWAGARRHPHLPQAPSPGPGDIRWVTLDVTSPASVADAMARIQHGTDGRGVLGLVNNAGIAVPGPVEAVPIERWREQFEVNLFGTLAVTQAAMPLLRQSVRACGRARVVMVGSISGLIATPILGPYCASKYALEALADALRLEVAPQGIGVSMVEPGPVQSEIWTKAAATAASLDRSLPVLGPYAAMIAAAERMVARAQRDAIPADRVARVVERCLAARRAPIRVQVGPGVRLGALLKRALPDRLMDALKARSFRA